MTAVNQDFTVYAGDAGYPQFTVRDASGNVIDISTSVQISWNAARDAKAAPVLTKTMTGGGVQLVGGGTAGVFQVNLSSADTAALSGYYLHEAAITDFSGNISTVSLGRMQVGRMPTWSYSGDPVNSPRDAVRFYISDTDEANQLILDPEIDFLLANYPSPLFAAAQAARNLAGKFAKQALSKRVGDLAITYANQATNYENLAASLEGQAARQGSTIYVGGVSRADMAAVAANPDKVKQPFRIKQFNIPNSADAAQIPGDDCE